MVELQAVLREAIKFVQDDEKIKRFIFKDLIILLIQEAAF